MPVQRETIKVQLARIQKAVPNRNMRTGQMYKSINETRRKSKLITLYGLFASDEGTFLIRPHIFRSANTRNARDWSDYLSEKYGTILRQNILPGMEDRTGKQWRLYRIIGWVRDDNTRLTNTPTRVRRNKTKRARR